MAKKHSPEIAKTALTQAAMMLVPGAGPLLAAMTAANTTKESGNRRQSTVPELVDVGESIERNADRVSARLKIVINDLLAVPGKSEIVVNGDDGETLTLGRQGTGWAVVYGFFIGERYYEEPWDRCSIDQRARVAQLLPLLAKELKDVMTHRKVALEAANNALDQLEQLSILNTAQEGA